MKVHLATLGCKLNESELEAWARRFAGSGCEIVDDPREADVCVLNTCTVTHIAARKSRQMARQLARANPHARLVLTGCLVDVSPGEAGALPNVALIVPNAEKDRLAESIQQIAESTQQREPPAISPMPSVTRPQPSPVSQHWLDADVETQVAGRKPQSSSPGTGYPSLRTRAFVKVQDGCNMGCAYCIIPLARGRERSRPREEVVREVKSLVDVGYKEIILTGVQISAYRGTGDGSAPALGLRDLVAAILTETAVPRLRLTSIAPWDLTESLLDLWRDPRLCRHLHLSLQSGSDTVLCRMHRPYTTAQMARAVQVARARIADVGITTDVIVGFPGETDAEFEQSLRFVEQMQFSRVHVFPYSVRAGTVAASLPFQVSDAVKGARAKRMQKIADASVRAFAQRFVGQAVQVLWEAREPSAGDGRLRGAKERQFAESGLWSGYTDNYIRVVAASAADLRNQFARARVTQVTSDGVVANLDDL